MGWEVMGWNVKSPCCKSLTSLKLTPQRDLNKPGGAGGSANELEELILVLCFSRYSYHDILTEPICLEDKLRPTVLGFLMGLSVQEAEA